MSAKVLIYVVVLTLATNHNISLREKLVECLIFMGGVLLGGGTLIAVKSKERIVPMKEIIPSFIIATFVGLLAHITMTNLNRIEWRFPAVLVFAFLSEWILKWVNTRYPKIFDWGFNKLTNSNTLKEDNKNENSKP